MSSSEPQPVDDDRRSPRADAESIDATTLARLLFCRKVLTTYSLVIALMAIQPFLFAAFVLVASSARSADGTAKAILVSSAVTSICAFAIAAGLRRLGFVSVLLTLVVTSALMVVPVAGIARQIVIARDEDVLTRAAPADLAPSGLAFMALFAPAALASAFVLRHWRSRLPRARLTDPNPFLRRFVGHEGAARWLSPPGRFLYHLAHFLALALAVVVAIVPSIAFGLLLQSLVPELDRSRPASQISQTEQVVRLLASLAPLLATMALTPFTFNFIWRRLRPTVISLYRRHLFADDRPPILLLRSFQDDLTQHRHWRRAWVRRGLEESLTEGLWRLGPVVAIGMPGETTPPIGAAREYVSNDQWQARVHELMSKARAIVVVAGLTPGIKWELARLRTSGFGRKTVLIIPGGGDQLAESEQRWLACTPEIAGSPVPVPSDGLPLAVVADHPTGLRAVVSSTTRSPRDVDAAVRIAALIALDDEFHAARTDAGESNARPPSPVEPD